MPKQPHIKDKPLKAAIIANFGEDVTSSFIVTVATEFRRLVVTVFEQFKSDLSEIKNDEDLLMRPSLGQIFIDQVLKQPFFETWKEKPHESIIMRQLVYWRKLKGNINRAKRNKPTRVESSNPGVV